MATAKIATLAIRTLAKPIATQIKHQAQSHERFRGICISLAQFMHRTEMALRSNLLASPGGSGEKAKVRPLNEAKAVTNGANALAEGFLFALAAALIIGESYRGSRSRAKQRDRTEEGLEELSMITKAIAERAGIDYREIETRVKEMQDVQEAVRESEEAEKHTGNEADEMQTDEESEHARHVAALRRKWEQVEKDRDRLQHAVNVLLRLALRSGWIQGNEALHLQSILDGTDQDVEESSNSNQTASDPPHFPSIKANQSILEQVAQLKKSSTSTRPTPIPQT